MSHANDEFRDTIIRLATQVRDEMEEYALQYQDDQTVSPTFKDDTPQIISWHQHLINLTQISIREESSDVNELIQLCFDMTLKGANVILATWNYRDQQAWFERAIPISQYIDNKQIEAQLKLHLGISSYYNVQFQKALSNFEKALNCNDIARQHRPQDLALLNTHIRILVTFIATYTQIGDYDKALEKGLEAQALVTDPLLQDNIILKQSIETNLGGAYFRKSMWTKAQQTYNSALQLAEQIKQPRLISQAEVNIANCLLATGAYRDVIGLYESALDRMKTTDNKLDVAQWYNNKAAILLDCGRLDDAAQACEQAQTLAWSDNETTNPRVTMASEYTKGKIYLAKSEYAEALDYFISVQKQAQHMQQLMYESISTGFIGRIALELQLWQPSDKLLQHSINLFDKLPPEEVVSIKVNQAMSAICQSQFKLAGNILDTAYQTALDISHIPSQAEALLWQAILKHQQNDPEKAINYAQKSLSLVENSGALIQNHIAQFLDVLSSPTQMDELLKLATYELSIGRRAIGLQHLNNINKELPEFDLNLIDKRDMEDKIMSCISNIKT